MNLDYYTGFEGDAEITFKTADQEMVITMWEGYFTNIIEDIMPNEQGMWEGLTLFHHTDTGWHDKSPFRLPELTVIIKQLENCDSSSWDYDTQQVYDNLLMLFKYASKNAVAVDVEYF
jgi:hypothetical protein